MPSKAAILNRIERTHDKALQQLLWTIGQRFTLFSYQFVGVRKLTGVPEVFPGEIETFDVAKVLRETRLCTVQRGVLMADVT